MIGLGVTRVSEGKPVCKFAVLRSVGGLPALVCSLVPNDALVCFHCGDFLPEGKEVVKNAKEE